MIILYASSGFPFKQKQKEKGSMTCHSAQCLFLFPTRKKCFQASNVVFIEMVFIVLQFQKEKSSGLDLKSWLTSSEAQTPQDSHIAVVKAGVP